MGFQRTCRELRHFGTVTHITNGRIVDGRLSSRFGVKTRGRWLCTTFPSVVSPRCVLAGAKSGLEHQTLLEVAPTLAGWVDMLHWTKLDRKRLQRLKNFSARRRLSRAAGLYVRSRTSDPLFFPTAPLEQHPAPQSQGRE